MVTGKWITDKDIKNSTYDNKWMEMPFNKTTVDFRRIG